MALFLETCVLLAATHLMTPNGVPGSQPQEDIIQLALDEPTPPRKAPEPPPKPIARPLPRITATQPAPTPRTAEPPTPVAESPVVEPVRPQSPPPPMHADDTAQYEADFAAALRAAIQAAVVYPPAARFGGFHGKARVEFLFKDGISTQVHILQGSGSNLIDQAALAAVTNALAPPLPESLRGKTKTYQVTVSFALNALR